MNKEEFAFVMNYLYTAYRQEPSKQEIKVYYNELGGCTQERVFGAARMWVRKSPFFPKIADLIKLIKDEEISFDQIMDELHYVISIPTGASFKSSDIHEVSYQILTALSGKFGISHLSEKELQKQVRLKYKHVVNEKILRLKDKAHKQIGKRTGTESLGMIMSNFLEK